MNISINTFNNIKYNVMHSIIDSKAQTYRLVHAKHMVKHWAIFSVRRFKNSESYSHRNVELSMSYFHNSIWN